MTLINDITKIFSPIDSSEIFIKEKFSTVEISDYKISNFTEINNETINQFKSLIKNTDQFSLFIKIENQDEILLNNTNTDDFINKIEYEIKNYENPEDDVTIKIEINKNTDKIINIYDINCFYSFWETLSAIKILELINKYKNDNNTLIFNITEPEFEEFYSNNIIFTKTQNHFNTNNKTINISENCHFNNYSTYSFDPTFFEMIKRPSSSNTITEWLDKFVLVFSITSLFDITSIEQNSNLYYKINGYKSFEQSIKINNISTDSKKTYYKIFNWVYSETSHISDKIGLTRNIISLYLKNESIEIDENTYFSIQSSYQTYLKDNVKSYIEIRNKITDELSWISQKSGEIIKDYINSYEKSIFVFLSFFISVFLFKFLKGGDIKNIFTIEATAFSVAFLVLSILFLCYSYYKIILETNRLEKKYDNIKNRYTDLLIKDDITRILNNDTEFNYEIDYIKKRKKSITSQWIWTIAILLATVILLSVFEYYKNIPKKTTINIPTTLNTIGNKQNKDYKENKTKVNKNKQPHLP